MKCDPMFWADFYKISHYLMGEKGTEKLYSTFTPRHSRIEGINEVVFFGLQGFIKDYIIEQFNVGFFKVKKSKVIKRYKRLISCTLGDGCADSSHIEALHDLGYLPIRIKAVKEGTLIPMRVPVFTIESTDENFYWLPLFMETFISANIWKVITSTTIVKKYRDICEKWSEKTCDDRSHIQWQCHNFSYRGMSGNEDATTTGAGHLLYFTGTDTIPSILYLEDYYGTNVEKELVGASVLATEHSIQCGYQDDMRYFKRMITEVAPNGIVSVVADGYDYWNFIGNIVPALKEDIMNRDGKAVIRPDSGSPIKIICGTVIVESLTNQNYCETLEKCKTWMLDGIKEEVRVETPHGEYGDSEVTRYFKFDNKIYKIVVEFDWNRYDKQYYYMDGSRVISCDEIELTIEQKGSVEALWDTFGGTVNSKGYKVLDSHVGLIYGDSITPEYAEEILKQLEEKGFASSNIVFGVGSYSLGYYTRDTFAFAMKATYTVINGEERFIFKDPKTDNGIKKSQRGMVVVLQDLDTGEIYFKDGLNAEERDNYKEYDLLEDVFVDGKMVREQTLAEIRAIVLK